MTKAMPEHLSQKPKLLKEAVVKRSQATGKKRRSWNWFLGENAIEGQIRLTSKSQIRLESNYGTGRLTKKIRGRKPRRSSRTATKTYAPGYSWKDGIDQPLTYQSILKGVKVISRDMSIGREKIETGRPTFEGAVLRSVKVMNQRDLFRLSQKKLLEAVRRHYANKLGQGHTAAITVDSQSLPGASTIGFAHGQDRLKQSSVDEILQTLQNPGSSLTQQIAAIYQVEMIPIPADDRESLLQHLRAFIAKHRGTQSSQLLMAAACAIRKFIAELPAANLNDLGFLLESSNSAPFPIELEVTVFKMIVRKLSANPPQLAEPYPELDLHLNGVVNVYLQDKLLTKPYFGAAALNATLALIMIRSSMASDVLKRLSGLKSRWFVESVSDRAEDVIKEIISRRPSEKEGPTVDAIQAAIQLMGVQQLAGNQ